MANHRDELEIEQIISTIRLQNRQHATEVWKIVLAAIAVTAAIVQAANLFFA